MLFIRADANPEIGSGHIMRCLTIAKVLQEKGQQVIFVTADHNAKEIIEKQGFHYICLESIWNSLEMELPRFKQLISEYEVRAVLIDSYFVTQNYLQQIKEITKVAYIDDLNEILCPVNLLINYNAYAADMGYELKYPSDTRLLLGCKYVPLRREFAHKGRREPHKWKDILITTGGGDQYNIAGHLAEAIRRERELDDMVIHIVVGPFNKHISVLEEMQAVNKNISLHHNVKVMSELMINSDLAISAGGSTIYELCACGIPTISFSYADNQWKVVKKFNRLGLIPYAGDFREDSIACTDNVIAQIQSLSKTSELRITTSLKMKDLVDGFGAERIAEELLIL